MHVGYNLFIKGYSIWQEPTHLVQKPSSYVIPGLRYEDRYKLCLTIGTVHYIVTFDDDCHDSQACLHVFFDVKRNS